MFPNGRHGSQETSQVHRLYCAGVEIRRFLLTELAGRMREEQDEALHACHVDSGIQVLRMRGCLPDLTLHRAGIRVWRPCTVF